MCDHCGCRSYGPIAELTAEHEVILSLAARVRDATRRNLPVEGDIRDDLLALVEAHAAKEELGLYSLLVVATASAPDTFAELEAEHRELRAAIAEGRFDHLAYYALERHIEEEEMVLFPAASFHFDGDTWDELERLHQESQREPLERTEVLLRYGPA